MTLLTAEGGPTVLPPRPMTAVAPRALAAVAAEIGGAPPVGLLGRAGGRRWALVEETPTHQAWIIAWPPGTGIDLHDHDGSTTGLHVVRGRLHERYVGPGGHLERRWWDEGNQLELPPDHVHEVHNTATAEAITIHVYSPRLRDVRFRTERSWVDPDLTIPAGRTRRGGST